MFWYWNYYEWTYDIEVMRTGRKEIDVEDMTLTDFTNFYLPVYYLSDCFEACWKCVCVCVCVHACSSNCQNCLGY